MKTKLLKVTLLFTMLFASAAQMSVNAIKPLFISDTDTIPKVEENFPHRSPANYSDAAYGVVNHVQGVLSITFEAEDPEIFIYIYKDGVLQCSAPCSSEVGDTYDFGLAGYGHGTYQVVIVMSTEPEELTGYFTY